MMNQIIKHLFVVIMLVGCSQELPCEPNICRTTCIDGYERCDVSDSAMDACVESCENLLIDTAACYQQDCAENASASTWTCLRPGLGGVCEDLTSAEIEFYSCVASIEKVQTLNCSEFRDAFETEPRSPWD
jgi:hypothetical protein